MYGVSVYRDLSPLPRRFKHRQRGRLQDCNKHLIIFLYWIYNFAIIAFEQNYRHPIPSTTSSCHLLIARLARTPAHAVRCATPVVDAHLIVDILAVDSHFALANDVLQRIPAHLLPVAAGFRVLDGDAVGRHITHLRHPEVLAAVCVPGGPGLVQRRHGSAIASNARVWRVAIGGRSCLYAGEKSGRADEEFPKRYHAGLVAFCMTRWVYTANAQRAVGRGKKKTMKVGRNLAAFMCNQCPAFLFLRRKHTEEQQWAVTYWGCKEVSVSQLSH